MFKKEKSMKLNEYLVVYQLEYNFYSSRTITYLLLKLEVLETRNLMWKIFVL